MQIHESVYIFAKGTFRAVLTTLYSSIMMDIMHLSTVQHSEP